MEHDMKEAKMVSMKRTADDKRGDKMMGPSIESTAPDFPYGLVIHLEKNEMEKLKMTMPKPGDMMMLHAKVKCTACRMSAVEGADDENSCDLQITDLDIEAE